MKFPFIVGSAKDFIYKFYLRPWVTYLIISRRGPIPSHHFLLHLFIFHYLFSSYLLSIIPFHLPSLHFISHHSSLSSINPFYFLSLLFISVLSLPITSFYSLSLSITFHYSIVISFDHCNLLIFFIYCYCFFYLNYFIKINTGIFSLKS